MGWYEKGSQKDPVQQLDSDLREFLEQETPDKYVPAPDVSTSHATAPSPSSTQFSGFSDDAAHSEPKVPAASLFQDGRYAHLWKTYKPPTGIDTQTSFTTGEGVVQRYRERANSVKSAAMENCVVENEALLLCAKTGSWKEQMKSRVTACSAERRNFSRCFELQSKFLMALGYAASLQDNPEKEEKIQVHADRLYHQMLDYETRVEQARANGSFPPPLQSLFNPDKPPHVEEFAGAVIEIPGGEEVPPNFKPSKPLIKLTPHERELEIRSHNAQLEHKRLFAEEASAFIKSRADSRDKREDKASSWFGQTIGRLFR
ncbi:hypothetical protein PDE_05217 [Penicillium oxalicum 114-2]|uniref:Uncharacterized protein n=1 Tax=Penicillium oxalicum (strain 114-2 / CGMCC 5302) TaxID=933388 RepID=S7ZNL3_PENO1|nr:hypothetical protein PDE_05217 [Penicillium oxalicum 114-2]